MDGGIFHTALAVSDVFLVKDIGVSLVKAGGKIFIKATVKTSLKVAGKKA
jgi:hypothetical protein